MAYQPYLLSFTPGIQRDGTELAGNTYTDGQWCRFQRGKPRKMGGYKTVSQNMTAVSRALHMQTLSGYSYIHSGFASGIEVFQVDAFGNSSVPSNLTPGGFTSDPNNVWQLDSYFDINSGAQQILAFQVPALMDIAYGESTGNLYAGPIYSTNALTAVSGLATDATGGICMIPPYLLIYGSNGLVQWSVPAAPLDLTDVGAGAARVTDQKIVRALPLWGNLGFSPAALLWSLNGVIKMYFVGGAPIFAFDPLTTQSSILSHNAVTAGSNGMFFWIAQDRFMATNGSVVQEVVNPHSINFFFDNLNRKHAQKAFAFYNSRWGEVWFCAPLFGATEPNWAVIYNDREQIWYDTPLPNKGRSFGVKNDIGQGMVMSGVETTTNSTFRLWQHEIGRDAIDGSVTSAINSFYTTGIITAATFQQPLDRDIKFDTLEPDYVQSGSMTVTPFLRGNARSPFQAAPSQSWADLASIPPQQQIPLKTTARQTKFTFTSNVAGGHFEEGNTMAYIEIDQSRRTR